MKTTSVRLRRSFYQRPTLEVALDLLGKVLVFKNEGETLGGRLVEVEAYIGEDDPACHAYRGRTPRNEIMYGKAGFLYVYFTYGNHYMLNIVTERVGFPAAVLLRGLEPLFGIETMMKRRGVRKATEAASGPGKIAKALGVTTKYKGLDLTGDVMYLVDDGEFSGEIWQSARIGITDGIEREWRFFVAGNPSVSKAGGQVAGTARRVTATNRSLHDRHA